MDIANTCRVYIFDNCDNFYGSKIYQCSYYGIMLLMTVLVLCHTAGHSLLVMAKIVMGLETASSEVTPTDCIK